MRLSNVEMYSANFEEAINFGLRDIPPTSQYMIREILGLDAEEIIPKFYGMGLNTKSRFYDFGLKPRDIVIRTVLNPNFVNDESYSNIRDDLYRAISANRTGQVVLHFRSGATLISRIFGSVTKFEVPYFTKLPEVQLTIHCSDPMFRAINPVLFNPADLSIANPVIVPDSLSTAPHGFTMQVTFKANTPTFTIQDVQTNPDWKFKIIPAGGFLNGDVLYFSSEFSNKYLYIIRGGTTIRLIDKIEPTSIWPIIFPGTNTFYFVDLASFNWNSLEYYASYWGV